MLAAIGFIDALVFSLKHRIGRKAEVKRPASCPATNKRAVDHSTARVRGGSKRLSLFSRCASPEDSDVRGRQTIIADRACAVRTSVACRPRTGTFPPMNWPAISAWARRAIVWNRWLIDCRRVRGLLHHVRRPWPITSLVRAIRDPLIVSSMRRDLFIGAWRIDPCHQPARFSAARRSVRRSPRISRERLS